MSECKNVVKLNAEELFDKLVEDSKRKELDKTKSVADYSCIGNDSKNKEQTLENRLDFSIEKIPEHLLKCNSEQSPNVILKPSDKNILAQSQEENKSPQNEMATMADSSINTNESKLKLASINDLPDSIDKHIFEYEEKIEQDNSFSFDDDSVPSYSLTDVQCLDQAVEDIILDRDDQVILKSPDKLSKTFFPKGSHFGSNIPLLKVNNFHCIKSTTMMSSEIELAEKVKNVNFSNTSAVLDESSNKENFENIHPPKRVEETVNTANGSSKQSLFLSPKAKAYPDIYLHKDKINILRQMSQVFNNEKSQTIVENDENVTNEENDANITNEENDIEMENYTEMTTVEKHCEIRKIMENDTKMAIIEKGTKMFSMENNIEMANTEKNKIIVNASYVENNKQTTENCGISTDKNEDRNSVPVHMVSSFASSSKDKKIEVESFTGSNGEFVDIIDGFTFVSFISKQVMNSYKDKKCISKHVMNSSKDKKFKNIRLKRRKRLKFTMKKRNHESNISKSLVEKDSTTPKSIKIDQIDEHSNSDEVKNVRQKDTVYSDIHQNLSSIKMDYKSNIVTDSNNLKSENKKSLDNNEMLYLYTGGRLITLAGSIRDTSSLEIGPLKGRVVLPVGMNYKDVKRKEDLNEVKPIQINKDLSTFACSALQSPEKPINKYCENILRENIIPKNVNTEEVSQKMYIKTNDSNYKEKENVDSNRVDLSVDRNTLKTKIEESPSKVKWTQDDVIKSPIGSANADKPSPSKKNIYRFPSLSREMKRLNMNFISYNQENQEDTMKSSKKDVCCNEPYCNLGCVCESLRCKKIAPNHCGQIDCMLECTCQVDNIAKNGISISRPNTLSLLNLDKEHKDSLALKEKEFKKTVVQTGSEVFLLERDRGKRDIKLPERYRDSNIPKCILPISSPILESPLPAAYIPAEDYGKHIKTFTIDMPWYELPTNVCIWCIDHNCYNCNCLVNSNSTSDILTESMDENIKESFLEIGSQSSAIICQKLKRSNHTYTFKYWIHNGQHHSARSCGYEVKNMKYEIIKQMPYHYPEPTIPLVMGMTAKINNRNYIITKPDSSHSPIKSCGTKLPNVNTEFTSSNNINKIFVNSLSSSEITRKSSGIQTSGINPTNVNHISLHWMIKEEEQRGELELNLCQITPGRTIIVSEARFKKLINLCIIGIVGLSNNRRCIINTVKSTEDLVKMKKIHQLIMNNTVDVGPNMKEIFSTQNANKSRYVMIRCDSAGRWEIFGVVQKKKTDTDHSIPVKKNGHTKTSISNSETLSENAVENIPEFVHKEKYVNESHSMEDGLPLITDVMSGSDPSINSFIDKDTSFNSSSEFITTKKQPLLQQSGSVPGRTFVIQRENSILGTLNKYPKLTERKNTPLVKMNSTVNVSKYQLSSSKAQYIYLPEKLHNSNVKFLVLPNNQNNISSVSHSTSNSVATTTNSYFKSLFTSNITKNCLSNNTNVQKLHSNTIGNEVDVTGAPIRSNSVTALIKPVSKYIPSTTETGLTKLVGKNSHTSIEKKSSQLQNSRKYVQNYGISNESSLPKVCLNDERIPRPNKCKEGEVTKDDNGILKAIMSGNTTVKSTYQRFSSSDDLNLRLDSSTDSDETEVDINIKDGSYDSITNSSNNVSNIETNNNGSNIKTNCNESSTKADSNVSNINDNSNDSNIIPSSNVNNISAKKDNKIVITTKKISNENISGPELVVLSSKKLEQCSAIDMSINFRFVKLHWLAGTINKSVLSTISIQSDRRNVPISLVVESSGRMVKFYGQHCKLSSNIPILILGTDLATVKKKSKLDLSEVFKANPVKYLLSFQNDYNSTFTYDKSGLNLIKLKNINRNKQTTTNFSEPLKVPVDMVRTTVLNSKDNIITPVYGNKINCNIRNTSAKDSSVSKSSIYPMFICKSGNKQVGNSSINKLKFCSKMPNMCTQFPIKRRIDDIQSENIFKKRKTCTSAMGDKGERKLCQTELIKHKQPELIDISNDGGCSNIDSTPKQDSCELPHNGGHSTPLNLFESSNRKAFGIACYDKESASTDSGVIEEFHFSLKSKDETDSSKLTLKASRKQCLKPANIRDWDTASESFDDGSSCSASESKSSGKNVPEVKKLKQRVAEAHNLKERLRRKGQSAMFCFLQATIATHDSINNQEMGYKASKDQVLNDAVSIIKDEDLKSEELVKLEIELQAERVKLLNRIEEFFLIMPENVKKEIKEMLNNIKEPSAKEEVIRTYKAKQLDSESITETTKKNSNRTFSHGTQRLSE